MGAMLGPAGIGCALESAGAILPSPSENWEYLVGGTSQREFAETIGVHKKLAGKRPEYGQNTFNRVKFLVGGTN